MGVIGRFVNAWNVFRDRDESFSGQGGFYGGSYGIRPDRTRFRMGGDRSIISSIYTRISIDVASIDIRHVRLDENDRYISDMPSSLNECLTVEANIDQASRAFFQDLVLTLFDQGDIAIVPVDVSDNPSETGGYNIYSLRVGRVVEWKPRHVKVDVYNDETGRHEQVTVPKSFVGLVENPLYPVMNETNSTLQRLIRKLNMLDAIDEQSASGKLDLIIQLPYVIKSESKRSQANQRRTDIENQLRGSKYGIAYTDGTEKVIQLNRPAENNMMAQVEYLTALLYEQLGLTKGVMDGTADEIAMLNYINRTVEPVIGAIVQEMRRKFLTKAARTQKQSILYFRDPFKLVPIANIAEIADKFTRNEIASANDIRQVIGWKPSSDPKAEQLRNSNIAAPAGEVVPGQVVSAPTDVADVSGAFDEVNKVVDGIFTELGVDSSAGP